MAYRDLRDWISALEREGELARIKVEVDWNLEIGGILRQVCDTGGPALLFENIKDYKKTLCTRLFTASLSTWSRMALMLGVPRDTPYPELIRVWRERTRKPIKPVMVATGPCKENILKGDDVDLFQFPLPHWNKLDGGRYISTFNGIVTKDPDTGWENVGLYRAAAHDRNTTSMSMGQGQHIWLHWKKYRPTRRNMPLAIVIGWDQALPVAASAPFPAGVDEYDMMGAIRQEAVELVKCETVDLRVPASAEIVIEGEVLTDVSTFKNDGPFAEFTGHYGGKSQRPVFKVKCITFRNNPIFQGATTGMPITDDHRCSSLSHTAAIWDLLDERMIGVTAVNVDPSTAYTNVIIQIDNSYYGQVQQAAANVWGSALSNSAKNIIVCDVDTDIYDLNKVFWAIAYRVDPPKDIIMFPGMINALDPVIHPSQRLSSGGNKGTRMLIDATKPIDNPRTDVWMGEKFPPLALPDKATMELVKKRWHQYGLK